MCTQDRSFPTSATIINGWIDTDWNDDLVNEDDHEDEQRDEQEYDDQYVANNREGPMEVDDLMQSLDGFDCELEDMEDQRCEIISTSISHDNEH